MKATAAVSVLATGIFAFSLVAHHSPAVARPDISGGAEGDSVFVAAVEETERELAGILATTPVSSDGSGSDPFVEYRWLSVCMTPTTAGPLAETVCSAAQVCATEDEVMYRLWGRDRDGLWTPLAAQCFGAASPPAGAPAPRITPGLVLNEIRRIGLPTLEALTQPEGKTLINFDTIFYTEARPFTATVRLLGRQVEVEARPSAYAWHHGDGEVTRTVVPGAPYPAKDVTYRYTDAGTTVRPRVDVTYTARFRVNGGAWQDIDETVTITGPEGTLRVAEAAPALSGDYG